MKTIIILFSMMVSVATYSQTAEEIINNVDEVANAPTDQKSELKIVLIDKNGNESIRTATLKSKGTDHMLFRFTSPAAQEGISVLSLPDEVMYLYLPAYQKERRINTSLKSQKFAGTDFCYEDMELKSLSDKYDETLLETTDTYWKLEMTPKPDKKTVYSKLVLTVNKSNYYIQQIEFYHKKSGEKIKILENLNTEKVDGYWIAKEAVMTDLDTNHKTKMIMTNISFDNGLSEDEFSVRALKQ